MKESIFKVAVLVALTGLFTVANAEINYLELVINDKHCKKGNQVACNKVAEIEERTKTEGFDQVKLQQAARDHQAYLNSVNYTTQQGIYNLNTMNGALVGGFTYDY